MKKTSVGDSHDRQIFKRHGHVLFYKFNWSTPQARFGRGCGQRKKRGDEIANSHILRCLTQPGLGKFCRRMRKAAQAAATGPRVSIKCMLSQWRLPNMPVASCSVFIFLKNIARVCPLSKLSPHDNCSSYDRLSEELAVVADSTTSRLSFLKIWSPLWRWNSQWVHTFHCQDISPSFFRLSQMARATERVIENQRQMIKSCPVLFCALGALGEREVEERSLRSFACFVRWKNPLSNWSNFNFRRLESATIGQLASFFVDLNNDLPWKSWQHAVGAFVSLLEELKVYFFLHC